jgi:hypothetical protein
VVARDAATAGAVRTAALLEQLEGEADDADDTLRALAQGIYPPLLEAEGLGAAVTAQAARSTLPVTVHATGLPRYPADVEVAVYFCILEALQNAAKYAQASSVHVRLEQRDDGLWFEVADDGIGFDPHHTGHGSGLTGIAARLDTIDGTLQIRSRPGTGTRITGHIPTTPPAASTEAAGRRRSRHERGPVDGPAVLARTGGGSRRTGAGSRCTGGSVIGGALALWAAALVTFLVLVVAYDLDFFGPLGGPWLLASARSRSPGAVIGWHRPGHVIALLFLVLGIAAPLANTLIALALGPFASPSDGAADAARRASVAATSMVFPLVPLAIVLFPDGRLPSPRWRWLPWLVGLASVLGGTAAFAAGGWGGDVDQTAVGAPFGGDLLGIAEVLSPLFFALIPVLLVSSGVAAVLRYRRRDAVTRQQLKWLALAALVLVLIVVWLVGHRGRGGDPAGLAGDRDVRGRRVRSRSAPPSRSCATGSTTSTSSSAGPSCSSPSRRSSPGCTP